jgi:hypothetical protein
MIDTIGQMLRGYVSPSRSAVRLRSPRRQEVASPGPLDSLGLALLSINLGFINPCQFRCWMEVTFFYLIVRQRRPVSVAALDWAFRGGRPFLPCYSSPQATISAFGVSFSA